MPEGRAVVVAVRGSAEGRAVEIPVGLVTESCPICPAGRLIARGGSVVVPVGAAADLHVVTAVDRQHVPRARSAGGAVVDTDVGLNRQCSRHRVAGLRHFACLDSCQLSVDRGQLVAQACVCSNAAVRLNGQLTTDHGHLAAETRVRADAVRRLRSERRRRRVIRLVPVPYRVAFCVCIERRARRHAVQQVRPRAGAERGADVHARASVQIQRAADARALVHCVGHGIADRDPVAAAHVRACGVGASADGDALVRGLGAIADADAAVGVRAVQADGDAELESVGRVAQRDPVLEGIRVVPDGGPFVFRVGVVPDRDALVASIRVHSDAHAEVASVCVRADGDAGSFAVGVPADRHAVPGADPCVVADLNRATVTVDHQLRVHADVDRQCSRHRVAGLGHFACLDSGQLSVDRGQLVAQACVCSNAAVRLNGQLTTDHGHLAAETRVRADAVRRLRSERRRRRVIRLVPVPYRVAFCVCIERRARREAGLQISPFAAAERRPIEHARASVQIQRAAESRGVVHFVVQHVADGDAIGSSLCPCPCPHGDIRIPTIRVDPKSQPTGRRVRMTSDRDPCALSIGEEADADPLVIGVGRVADRYGFVVSPSIRAHADTIPMRLAIVTDGNGACGTIRAQPNSHCVQYATGPGTNNGRAAETACLPAHGNTPVGSNSLFADHNCVATTADDETGVRSDVQHQRPCHRVAGLRHFAGLNNGQLTTDHGHLAAQACVGPNAVARLRCQLTTDH